MSIIIFTGPTLSPAQASEILDADFRPPARQGDVYRACLEQPKVVAIIDGYFENVPAVWHKEILYAMSQGIHVFGCASMGALRAAELSSFGMQGIGQIYQQFIDGGLEDDDEVAVTHAPPQLNYQSLSEAMVNIRATLQGAKNAGILSQTQYKKLIDDAKATWYPKRSYSKLLDDAATWLDKEKHSALSSFISKQSSNVKQDDAHLLLRHLARLNIKQLAAKTVDYAFVHTDAWEALVEYEKAQQFKQQNTVNIEALHTELKLQGQYHHYKTQAQARQIAIDKTRQHQHSLSPQQLKNSLLSFSEQQQCIVDGQIDFQRLTKWFTSQQLDMPQFDRLIRKQAMLDWVDSLYQDVDEELLDVLRLSSKLGPLCERIEAKASLCQSQPQILLASQLGLSDDEMWQWYFSSWLNQPLPASLADYARAAGFTDLDAMRQAVLMHYQWQVCR